MADYSTYRSPPTEGHYGPPHSNFDPLRRSGTHNSHYSHVTTSTQSWVQSNLQNPPPPPLEDEELEQSMSPARTPRPLPQPQFRPQTLHTVNATDDEDEEYMNIDPNVSGQYEFQHTPHGIFPTRRVVAASPEPIPAPPQPTKQRSLVGGLVRGLRRLPKRMMGYGVSNEKGRLFRRGTFGTEVSGGATDAGMTTGNTLPLYRSNPSTPVAGPSTVQYVQDFRMAFPHPPPPPVIPEVMRAPSEDTPIPNSLLPGGLLRRPPTVLVTPPSNSESVSHESHAQIYQSPQPHYVEVIHPDVQAVNNAERTTVMVYGESVDAAMPIAESALQRTSSRMHPQVPVTPIAPRAPSITIQAPVARPPSAPEPLPQPDQEADIIQSPATEDPLPAPDYRKMPHFPGSPSRRTLMTATGTSWYDPSFTSDLTPVERFFKTLYHLPWVSHGRVTIDYRPGAGFQGKDKNKAMVKKPMASWYRRFSRSSKSAELDLLSNGTPETTPRTSVGTSMMSSMASPRSLRTKRSLGTNDSRNQRSSGHRRRRKHRNRRRSMSTIEEPDRGGSPIIPAVYPYPYPAYPFTYPGYAAVPPTLPYPPGMSPPTSPNGSPSNNPHTPPMPMQMAAMPVAAPVPVQAQAQHQSSRHNTTSGSKRTPRGPRSRSTRRPTYPNGYAPYQAMAFPPPPIYMAPHPSPGAPNGGQLGEGAAGTGATPPHHAPHMMQPVYVPMQVVPGAYHTPDILNSTTTSIPSPPSSPTPRAASAAPQQVPN